MCSKGSSDCSSLDIKKCFLVRKLLDAIMNSTQSCRLFLGADEVLACCVSLKLAVFPCHLRAESVVEWVPLTTQHQRSPRMCPSLHHGLRKVQPWDVPPPSAPVTSHWLWGWCPTWSGTNTLMSPPQQMVPQWTSGITWANPSSSLGIWKLTLRKRSQALTGFLDGKLEN